MASAADAAFTVKVGEKTFTLSRIKLGDWLMLKTQFGLTYDDIIQSFTNPETGETVEILNLADPGVLIGLMVAALREERPNVPIARLRAEVEDLDMGDIQFSPDEDEDEPEADPTQAGDEAGAEEAASPVKGGKSAKRPKQPGTPR